MIGLLTSYKRRRVRDFCAHLVILRAKHLINMLADNVGQAQTKTYCEPLCNVNIEAIIDTLGFVEAGILVKSWADTAVNVETMTVD